MGEVINTFSPCLNLVHTLLTFFFPLKGVNLPSEFSF